MKRVLLRTSSFIRSARRIIRKDLIAAEVVTFQLAYPHSDGTVYLIVPRLKREDTQTLYTFRFNQSNPRLMCPDYGNRSPDQL